MENKDEGELTIAIHVARSSGDAPCQLQLNEPSNRKPENSKSPSLLFKHYENKQIKRESHCKTVKKALFIIGSVFAVAVIAFLGTVSEESTVRTLTSTVMPSTPRPVSTNGMQIEGELFPKDYSALDGRFPVPTFKRDNGQSVPIKSYMSLVGIVHGFDIEGKRRVPTERSLTELQRTWTVVPSASVFPNVMKSQPIPFSMPNFDDYDDWDAEYVYSPVTYNC